MKACEKCGRPVASADRRRRFCGRSCANSVTAAGRIGAANSNWRGGKIEHPLYDSWADLVARCRRPTHQRYKDYGGRGITVCDRWADDFWAFVDDVGERPDGHMLDRIDNDRGYEPGNIRWATPSVSNKNRRPTHLGRQRNEMGQFT